MLDIEQEIHRLEEEWGIALAQKIEAEIQWKKAQDEYSKATEREAVAREKMVQKITTRSHAV